MKVKSPDFWGVLLGITLAMNTATRTFAAIGFFLTGTAAQAQSFSGNWIDPGTFLPKDQYISAEMKPDADALRKDISALDAGQKSKLFKAITQPSDTDEPAIAALRSRYGSFMIRNNVRIIPGNLDFVDLGATAAQNKLHDGSARELAQKLAKGGIQVTIDPSMPFFGPMAFTFTMDREARASRSCLGPDAKAHCRLTLPLATNDQLALTETIFIGAYNSGKLNTTRTEASGGHGVEVCFLPNPFLPNPAQIKGAANKTPSRPIYLQLEAVTPNVRFSCLNQ